MTLLNNTDLAAFMKTPRYHEQCIEDYSREISHCRDWIAEQQGKIETMENRIAEHQHVLENMK